MSIQQYLDKLHSIRAAAGPWIITSHGAVVHDSGGYGMLGMGHAPESLLAVMSAPMVMANVMTPSFSQQRLTDRLIKEIGRSRGQCPFDKFVFLNSGSESVTFTCRVADIHARRMTDPGCRHLAIPHKFFLDTGGVGTGLATCESHFMIGTI